MAILHKRRVNCDISISSIEINFCLFHAVLTNTDSNEWIMNKYHRWSKWRVCGVCFLVLFSQMSKLIYTQSSCSFCPDPLFLDNGWKKDFGHSEFEWAVTQHELNLKRQNSIKCAERACFTTCRFQLIFLLVILVAAMCSKLQWQIFFTVQLFKQTHKWFVKRVDYMLNTMPERRPGKRPQKLEVCGVYLLIYA